MNPGRFFMPRLENSLSPMINSNFLPSRSSIGLFGRIANSLKSFNWGNLLNGANKTLNVVNQTIPLIRQTGPMLNNLKSMMRIAKVFGSETTNSKTVSRKSTNSINNKTINNPVESISIDNKESLSNSDNNPVFFI